MKMLRQPLFWACLNLLFGWGLSYGQGNPKRTTPPEPSVDAALNGRLLADSLYFDFNQDISTQLLSFEDLYAKAVVFSPAVRFEEAIVNSQNAAYRLSKLQVLQNATGYSNYSTGNQAIFSTGTSIASDQIGQIANGYRTGVSISLSLHDVFGRPQQIRLARANYESALQRRRTVELDLKRVLYNLYQDLLTSQRVLHIRLQDEQASLAAFRIAEVELQKGKITPEAHAFNSSRYTQTKVTSEQAKSELIKNIFSLEVAVGVPIHQLKRN